jgi:hypothetical protein
MNISRYISLPVFLVSFAVGLFCIYVIGPETKTIYKYPSPENYATFQFKDSANQCFQFQPKETTCPMNPLSIKTVPVQWNEWFAALKRI